MLKRLMLLNFRLVHRASRRVSRRFTPAGRVVLATMVAAGALGVDTRQSLAYQTFALLLAVVLVSMAGAPLFRARFSVRRHLPRFVTVGQPFAYRVAVKNLSSRMQRDLLLIDELEVQPPSAQVFLRTPQPGEENQNWFDRAVGYPRWAWLMHRQAGAQIPELPVPPVAAGATVEVEIRTTPLRRGYLRYCGLRVARPDPFGLFKSLRSFGNRDSLLVLPRRYRVAAPALPGSRRYQPGGISLASHVGDSEEFISLRDYRPGDPSRRIHWRSWARTGRPIVKEFQDEFFVRHALLLDTFISADNELFEEAVSVASSFALSVRNQDALLDLMFVGARVHRFTAGRGLASAERLLEILACVEPCTDKPFTDLVQAVTEHAGDLSGCICVLLDWGPERRHLGETLAALGVPTLAVVLRPSGADPQPDPGALAHPPHRFVALSVGEIEQGLARL